MSRREPRLGLRAQLLLLLLAFGAIPLAAAIGIGYALSRTIITDQSQDALRELGRQQALHISTELIRQRLLLRTITGQLGDQEALSRLRQEGVAHLLEQSLTEDGVFDGLRLVTGSGRILVSVALRETAPQWPKQAPAALWGSHNVIVHWEGDEAVAYLIGVPVGGSADSLWLEGHVRSEDFNRLFAIPTHLIGSIESTILDRGGRPVYAAHAHAAEDIAAHFKLVPMDSAVVRQATIEETASLVIMVPVGGTSWIFAAALPLDVALAPLAQLRGVAMFGFGLFVLLIALTAFIVARSLGMPLTSLANAARRFGRGESYGSVPRTGTAEVQLLVDAFSQMADALTRSQQRIERLHQQAMERAQQLATAGEMASGVAHEIRNPVTGIMGALELVLGKLPPDDASRRLLEEAQTQLRRIEAATSQLLQYARPPVLREAVIDANMLVDRAARVVEAQAEGAGVQLSTEPATEPVHTNVDPELMVQVLVNLMLNGIQAMQAGGHLTVRVERLAPDVRIGVRDTGPGIPAELRAEIFRPFFTTKHQGTGLGLSISQQIVNRHGGVLQVEDTPGGGATFFVALPLAEREGTSREQGIS